MDLSKLTSFMRMAALAGIVVVVTGVVANIMSDWGDLYWLAIIAAALTVIVAFLPQIAPNTKVPGSPGSVLLLLGGVGGVAAVIYALQWSGWILDHITRIDTILFLVGLAASVYLAWNGWKAFKAEGGKFTLGMAGGSVAPPAAPAPTFTPTPPSPMAAPESTANSGVEGSEDQPQG